MERVTVSVAEEDVETLDAIEEREEGVSSTSEAVRYCIREYESAQSRADELADEVEDVQARLDERTRQLAVANTRVDEHQELVRYVEDEIETREEWESANLLKRAKWWVMGRDGGD